MSVSNVQVLVPPTRQAGAGAVLLSNGVAAAALGLRGALLGLAGRLRENAARRREVKSRADVMALARRCQSSQPSFAKDLYAAANNPERF